MKGPIGNVRLCVSRGAGRGFREARARIKDAIVSQEKKDEAFRVIDRRPFTPEGELRPEAAELEKAEKRAVPAPAKEAAGAKPDKGAAKTAETAAAGTAAAPAASEPKASRQFQTLIGLVARYAEASLGAYADPQTGQPIMDIEGARAIVDVLDDLREKTAGRLAAEDSQLLDDVLGNLKLACVEMEQATLPGGTAGPADAAAGRPMGARGREIRK